jgi:hypothetical protein
MSFRLVELLNADKANQFISTFLHSLEKPADLQNTLEMLCVMSLVVQMTLVDYMRLLLQPNRKVILSLSTLEPLLMTLYCKNR